jgi:hypothetical protein
LLLPGFPYALIGFPYALIYVLETDAIVVLGCCHTARNPSVWQERSDRYLP